MRCALSRRRGAIAGACLALLVLLAVSAAAESDLPDGPGKDAVEKVCSSCHGLDVITQERGTKDHWNAIVDDMVSRGAEASDSEIDQVVKYLVAHFGPQKVNVNQAAADDLVKALALSRQDASAIVDYRTKNGAFKDLDALKSVPGINAKKIEDEKDFIEF